MLDNMAATAIIAQVYNLVDVWLAMRLVGWYLLTYFAAVRVVLDDVVDFVRWKELARVPFVPRLAATLLAGSLFGPADLPPVAEAVAR